MNDLQNAIREEMQRRYHTPSEHCEFIVGAEWAVRFFAAQRALQRVDAYLKESLSGQVSKSYYLRERAQALYAFAGELDE